MFNALPLDESGTSRREPFELIDAHKHRSPPVILIEPQQFLREVLGEVIRAHLGTQVVGVASLEALRNSDAAANATLCILRIDASLRQGTEAMVGEALQHAGVDRLAVMSDCTDTDVIRRLFGAGIKGFLPSSLPLGVAVQALRLIQAGGIYVPIELLTGVATNWSADDTQEDAGEEAANAPLNDAETEPSAIAISAALPEQLAADKRLREFTPRQNEIINALRVGLSNKLIAYRLNLSEGTVKVHVRDIMRKLNATNRTEAVYFINELMRRETARN